MACSGKLRTAAYKVVLAGDSGVGKSSIFVRYKDGMFVENLEGTIRLDHMTKTVTIKNQKFKVQLSTSIHCARVKG